MVFENINEILDNKNYADEVIKWLTAQQRESGIINLVELRNPNLNEIMELCPFGLNVISLGSVFIPIAQPNGYEFRLLALLSTRMLLCICEHYDYTCVVTSARPSCNNVAPVTNLCLGGATKRFHSSQWSKK